MKRNMIDIKYKVEFFNEWHTGSGLSAGADVDDLVIKDKDGLPFIPGKTVKGLLRQALEEVVEFRNEYDEKIEIIESTFGLFKEESADNEVQTDSDKKGRLIRGTIFCTNVTLSPDLAHNIKSTKTSEYLYRSVASTSIDKDGIAKEHSLRKIETTVPCVLYGEILDVHESLKDDLVDALGYIKRLGVNRNRGLGRCRFNVINNEEKTA